MSQPQLDRDMARALVDAGYMPVSEYVAAYGDSDEAKRSLRKPLGTNGRRKTPSRSRPWIAPRALRRVTALKRRA